MTGCADPYLHGKLDAILDRIAVCQPGAITSFTADAIVLDASCPGFNSIGVFKPECCTVTVTTNLGTFVIPPGVRAYSPDKFDCGLITELAVTVDGGCALDEVHITLQYTGGPCPT